jgi:flagellar protein FliL
MSKKVLIIFLGAIVLMMGMMGGGFFILWQKMSVSIAQVQNQNSVDQKDDEKKSAQEPSMGPIYKLDTLIVNLADQGGKRYLRVTMELELSSAEVAKEIDQRLPQLRDAILMILPSKKYEDISTTQGKIELRNELVAKMNSILQTGTVVSIYFTEFVVQ